MATGIRLPESERPWISTRAFILCIPKRRRYMRRNHKLLSLILACGWLNAAPCFALTGDTEQPIRIKADTAELNDKTGISVYRGNVRVTQGSIVLEARTVRIMAPQKEIEKIIEIGRASW